MLFGKALAFANHLLADEAWARRRLQAFSGQTVRVRCAFLDRPLSIAADGYLLAGEDSAEARVIVELPADAPLRALFDRPSLMAAIRISGAADLAENLGFVARHLQWDVEDDLSTLVGDIAARRLVATGRQLFAWQQAQATNLARHLAEYFTDENPTLLGHNELSTFASGTAGAREALSSLERRVARLERLG